MSKLTLSVDPKVVVRAKRYAAERGASVSKLVEQYLRHITADPADSALPPMLRLVLGAAEGYEGDENAYREHLERKYS